MLVSDAISQAYREAAIKPLGATPTFEELTEGLNRLNGFLDSLFGAEIGEVLGEWQVPSVQRAAPRPSNTVAAPFPSNLTTFDQTPPPLQGSTDISAYPPMNSRLLWRTTSPATVYFPEYPSDGARMALVDTGATASITLNGNGRLIEGAATKVVTIGAEPQEWFYRSDLGNWIALAPLTFTDNLPLPSAFDRLIICGTAISLTALDEINPTTGTMFMYERLLKRCQQRYKQRGTTSYGGQNLAPTFQSYNPNRLDQVW